MAGILTFIKERLPIPTYLILVGGISVSGSLLLGAPWLHRSTGLSIAGLLLFFVVLRTMDEYKDYEKDLIAHPERPLPRGVIPIQQVQRMIQWGIIGMTLISIVALFLSPPASAFCYLFITGYLWLMYKEFYAGSWLSSRPILYATSHQLIIIPLCLFTPLLVQNDALSNIQTVHFGLLILTAFFSYEICRKLDPNAHPILLTYLTHYGRGKTYFMVFVLTLGGSVLAFILETGPILWPIQGMLLLSLLILWFSPKAYKIPESIATLSLLIHLWVIPIVRLIR